MPYSKGLVVGDFLHDEKDGNTLPIFVEWQPHNDRVCVPCPILLKLRPL